MKINVSKLSEGIHEYGLSAEPAEIGLDDQFHSTVHVAIRLEKRNRQIHLEGHVETTAQFQCDRCIDEFEMQIGRSYEMFYITEESERNLYEPDEVQVISSDINEIDISDDVRQMVLLAIPQKLLCKETCAGLCPHCGRNLNRDRCTCARDEVDPRWDKLRGLMNYQ